MPTNQAAEEEVIYLDEPYYAFTFALPFDYPYLDDLTFTVVDADSNLMSDATLTIADDYINNKLKVTYDPSTPEQVLDYYLLA